jgi:hypothetical protein
MGTKLTDLENDMAPNERERMNDNIEAGKTPLEKVREELGKFIPSVHGGAQWFAIDALIAEAKAEQKEVALEAIHKLYKYDRTGWCSPVHPCQHDSQVDCVLAAIRGGEDDPTKTTA